MADVRSLLRNERNARRISHPHATYSTTGTLVCLVCHIQLKSESLWNTHLRSAQHAMRLQRIRDGTLGRPPGAPPPESQQQVKSDQEEEAESEPGDDTSGDTNGLSAAKNNKRKTDDEGEPIRKRSKVGALPDGFFDQATPEELETVVMPTKTTPPLTGHEVQLPSRPATPMKTPETMIPPRLLAVDEDEWAAFEADIAATEAPIAEEAVISAPAMSTAELAAKSREEENAHRKERHEAELEGEKEDAARKLEDEFEEMEALEGRIRKLKEKREALRLKEGGGNTTALADNLQPDAATSDPTKVNGAEDDEEDDDEEDDDDWDGFRLKA